MPLSERTERALEACHDAVLSPPRWGSALQLLGESLGAASCTFYEHDQENWAGRLPISTGHEGFDDLWLRNQISAPDPHVGVYLQKCNAFIKAGCPSAVEHQFSTEEERRTLPYYWGNGADGEPRLACIGVFLRRGPRLVSLALPRRRPGSVHAGGRATHRRSWTVRRQNCQSGPQIRRLRCRVEALNT